MPTLVVGPSWVGDMVMAHGLISYLKTKRPDDPIHVLAPAWSINVARRMVEIDHVIELPFDHGELKLRERWAFARRLKVSRYHRAFILPNSLKSALIPAMAGIPRRIGWRGEYRYKLLTDFRILRESRFPRMIDRYMALGFPANLALSANQLPEAPGYPKLSTDKESQARLTDYHGLNTRKLVAICHGAEFGLSKKWPLDRYSKLVSRLLEDGKQVALLGSPNDENDADIIAQKIPVALHGNLKVLTGLTSIPEAIDIIALAQAVVTNDSGLMHVAAATERPLVALFGPTSPLHTPPLSGNAVILNSASGDISNISVEEVFDELSSQMQKKI